MLTEVSGNLLDADVDALVNAVNTAGVMGKGIALDWRSRARLADVEAGLAELVRVVAELGIGSLAVPALGAGNGGLPWEQVRPLLQRALGRLPGTDVLLYLPGSS
jgi:O-acetyl-ADP-ribose deacetylase (regulator of RNase III)